MAGRTGRGRAVVAGVAAVLLASAAAASAANLNGSTAAPAAQPAAMVPTASSHPAVVTLVPGHAMPGMALPAAAVKVRAWHGSAATLAADAPTGYTPANLASMLGLHGDGSGQQVALVDAYDDPNIEADLNTYSQQFGLPLSCGTPGAGSDCFTFTKKLAYATGTDQGWALEESLDAEMIHAAAPKAAITVVETGTASPADLWGGVDTAAKLRPAAISNSWGLRGAEYPGEQSENRHCALARTVCVFAAGDWGYPGGFPAYMPDVLAIGGTTLTLDAAGKPASESVWNPGGMITGTGGGVGYVEPRPAYQAKVNPYKFRSIPDVSFDADPQTGFAIYDSIGLYGQAGWFQVGGTSAGAPAWAAILAVADQLRAAAGKTPLTAAGYEVQDAIYGLRDSLFDITDSNPAAPGRGNNTGYPWTCTTICLPHAGYDFASGLGSPRPGIDTALASAR